MKLCQIIFGIFKFKRVPAAQIDGGMGEYAFQQFQPLPPVDPINGRGYHVRKNLNLLSPALVVIHPAGTPYDVFKIPEGNIDILIDGGIGGYES
jgi:hypothetical protein